MTSTTRRVVPQIQIPSIQLRPVAAPTGAPVRPPVSTDLQETVRALSGVSEGLGQLSDIMAKQEDTTSQARGSQLASEIFESGKSYREAIQSGQITPAQSPWFQLGFNEQFGRLSATRFGSDLQREISSGALKDETDMGKFDQFVTQYQQNWTKDNVGEDRQNEAFRMGFSRQVDGIIEGARYQFANTAGQNITKQTAEQTYQEAYNVLNLGLTNNDPLDAIAGRINQMADGLKAQGMNMSTANLSIAQAIARVARDRKDARILDLAQNVRAGSGNLSGVRSEVGQLFEESRDYILNSEHQHGQWEQQEREQTRITESRSTVNQAMAQLMQAPNPSSVDLSGFEKKLQDLGSYDFINDLHGVQQSLVELQNPSNADKVRSLMVQIFQHTQSSDPEYLDSIKLSRALQNHQINTQDFGTLLGYLAQRDNMTGASSNGPDFFSETSQFNNAVTRVRSLFASDFDFSEEKAERANRAQAEFIASYLSWRNTPDGQSADASGRNEFITKTLNDLGQRWRSDNDIINDLPDPNLDPNQPPVWHTRAVMSKAAYGALIADIQDGGGLSANNRRMLQLRNVTPENIQEFLSTQGRLLQINQQPSTTR